MREDPPATREGGSIALVALHAGYSHSSLALRAIRAHASGEAFHDRIRLFETLVNQSHQGLIEALLSARPGVIGFSTYLWNIRAAIRLAGVLRQLLPDCCLVFGGPEAGPRGRELLRELPFLDYVIEGEGEAAFRDLLRWLLAGEGDPAKISGLVYRAEGGHIRANPPRLLSPEEIPSPIARGEADFDKSLVYWETSRGCPYRCSFCGSADERLRAFPLERVEADLRVLERLRDKTIKLLDRSFHLGRERTRRLLERFAQTPSGLRFHLELNPDRISAEAMEIFRHAEAGKFQFEIGLQSLQAPVLQAVERQMEIPKALENIRQLVAMRRHPVHLDLIVGLPGEDARQCADSLDRVFALYPDHLQLGVLKLLPGTPLRERALRLGYRWDREPPYEVLSHPRLDFFQIARFKRDAELLERLWNSGLLATTLAGLAEHCFAGSVSACFDALIAEQGEGMARDKLQPDALFGGLVRFVLPRLEHQPLLAQWLLWDYARHSLVNRKTPAWIAAALAESSKQVVDGSRRPLPVLALSAHAVDLIRRVSGQRLDPGRYAIWPRQHLKGRPVELIRLFPETGA